jgi:hypothetical protein
MIVEHRELNPDSFHPDGLFIPVCYLYRHSLELLIKVVIRCGVNGNAFPLDEDLERLLAGHNLGKLWERCRVAIEWRWPEGDKKVLNNAQALIRDFHVLDRTGQGLRYALTLEGRANAESFPDQICLRYLADSFNSIYHFLSAIGGAPWTHE